LSLPPAYGSKRATKLSFSNGLLTAPGIRVFSAFRVFASYTFSYPSSDVSSPLASTAFISSLSSTKLLRVTLTLNAGPFFLGCKQCATEAEWRRLAILDLLLDTAPPITADNIDSVVDSFDSIDSLKGGLQELL
jgi:hypothetical protein